MAFRGRRGGFLRSDLGENRNQILRHIWPYHLLGIYFCTNKSCRIDLQENINELDTLSCKLALMLSAFCLAKY